MLSVQSALAARSAASQQLDAALSGMLEASEARLRPGLLCNKSRYELLLQPDSGAIEAAIREALDGPLGKLLKAVVGLEAPLYELAAIVPDKGAPQQPLHFDAGYEAGLRSYTTFVALQDVGTEMGPTLFLPGTHTKEAHAAKMVRSEFDDLLQETPSVSSMLSVGDCSVFDSRLFYADTPNTYGRRVLLAFTFLDLASDLSNASISSSPISQAQGYRLIDFLPETERKQ